MASSSSSKCTHKFTVQEIDRFNDRISHVLENGVCRRIFKEYLTKARNPKLSLVFKLWEKADSATSFDEDAFLDLIEEIDDFNINPLYSHTEYEHKLLYIKQESCRILEKIRPWFIEYLNKYHQ